MVIKALIDAWRSKAVMSHMYEELQEMLQATEWMFKTIGSVMFDETDPSGVSDALYRTDRKVNKAERRIRKEIVEHLAIRPEGDVPACLVLMSVIKDAERIGDYCKNLFEVREILGRSLKGDEDARHMQEIHGRIIAIFDKTQQALREGNEELARAIMVSEKEFSHEVDRKVREVAESDMPTRKAVCLALSLRHMKRIYSHLSNIASGLVQPVHKIDYVNNEPFPPKE